MRSKIILIVATAIVTSALVGGTAWALISPIDSHRVIHGCYNASTGAVVLNVTGRCPASASKAIAWNVQGPKGATGAQGIQGVQGPKGDTGPQGPPGPVTPPVHGRVILLPDTGITLEYVQGASVVRTYTTAAPIDTSDCSSVSAYVTSTHDATTRIAGIGLFTYMPNSPSPVPVSFQAPTTFQADNAAVGTAGASASFSGSPGPLSGVRIDTDDTGAGMTPLVINNIWLYCIPRS
jgi:hypothetical protein